MEILSLMISMPNETSGVMSKDVKLMLVITFSNLLDFTFQVSKFRKKEKQRHLGRTTSETA